MRTLIIAALLCSSATAQLTMQIGKNATVAPITVEATCTGGASTKVVACSSPMTVTAGDTLECTASTVGFDPLNLIFNDSINGGYDAVVGFVHPGNSSTWVATAVFQNSAGGSITPQVTNWEAAAMNLKCRALKGTRSTFALDGGAVNQTQSTTAANPTSGTAAAPTNKNQIVIGVMVRGSTTTVSDAAPWVPGGTITAIGSSYPIYDHYNIQTTATAVNSPMTAASTAFIDTQFSVLNASNPAGYRSLTGFYGAPAIAKSNGASVTAADLSGATTTVSSQRATFSPGWALGGAAATYDTLITPFGTGKVMVQGITHGIGDAATSINFGSSTSTDYTWTEKFPSQGEPIWFSAFVRIASSGTSSGQGCDGELIDGGITESAMDAQWHYDTGTGVSVFFEAEPSGGNSAPLTGFSLDTDYWVQLHLAGVNERYHQFLVYAKSGSTWSLAGTLNYDVLCATQTVVPCTTPPTAGSGTGIALSSSTSLAITGGSGTIAAGQAVIPMTGIPYLTMVEAVSGTCSVACTVTLSQNTTGAISGTVNFTTGPATLDSATNGTASSGSTALTVVSPTNGSITVGDPVGGAGIPNGTFVAAVGGTAVTLSQPTNAALSSSGVTFWKGPSANRGVRLGKFSSCSIGGSVWYSGLFFDPIGTWGAFAPN